MINQKDLEEILLQNKILDDKQLKKYSERTRKSTETLEDVIVEEQPNYGAYKQYIELSKLREVVEDLIGELDVDIKNVVSKKDDKSFNPFGLGKNVGILGVCTCYKKQILERFSEAWKE